MAVKEKSKQVRAFFLTVVLLLFEQLFFSETQDHYHQI